MKTFKSLCILLCALFLQTWTQTASAQTSTSKTDYNLIPIDAAHFPDPNFRAYIEENMITMGINNSHKTNATYGKSTTESLTVLTKE